MWIDFTSPFLNRDINSLLIHSYIRHYTDQFCLTYINMSKLYSPARTTFQIPTGTSTKGDDTTIPIHISAPDIKAENLPLSTWTASVVLAAQLHKFDFCLPPTDRQQQQTSSADLPEGNGNGGSDGSPAATATDVIPVLELGAGTGLVGLSAACLWKTRVVLTDLPPIVEGLVANARLNVQGIERVGGSVGCGSLDWSRPSSMILAAAAAAEGNGEEEQKSVVVSSARRARVILAADTIYDSDHPELLAAAIFEWLERSGEARVCVCYPLRVAYLDEIRELWGRLEEGGLVCILEGKEMYEAESPNGDDEMLCEWSVWRWMEGVV